MFKKVTVGDSVFMEFGNGLVNPQEVRSILGVGDSREVLFRDGSRAKVVPLDLRDQPASGSPDETRAP
jgi:hypothetical protein